jgi:hypothetical protein
MIGWPSSLPEKLRNDGFSSQARSNVAIAEPEVGEVMTRVRFTGRVDDVVGKLTLTGEELRILENFWQYDLKFGALPFSWDHPTLQIAATAHFLGRPVRPSALPGDLFDVDLPLQFTT